MEISSESEDGDAETAIAGDEDANDSSVARLKSQEAETSRIQVLTFIL